MATYFVASGGSNTAPYDTWAKAATSLQTALTAANAAGDIVVIQYNGVPSGDAELAANTVYTFGNHVALIAASNDGGSAYTPTAMGTANWIGNSTASRSIDIAGAFRLYFYGVTFRIDAASSNNLTLGDTAGQHLVAESCVLWNGSTGAAAAIQLGDIDNPAYIKLINPTIRLGANGASNTVRIECKLEIQGGSLDVTEATPSNLFTFGLQDPGGATADIEGFDFTNLGANNIFGNATINAGVARLTRCKLGASNVILATQTLGNRAGAEVYLFDCASGDTHGLFGYYNAMGSVVSDTGIYFTSGAAAQSWKIVTTANASFWTPFETPWVDWYNTGTSAITPYIEILRDGSATAFQNDEVWAEFSAKVTSGSTQASFYKDRMTLTGTPADQAAGAGLGSWTGGGGTAWSGKIDSGTSLTPAENGHIRGRIVVGEPSITVYADPQIRT